MSTSLTIVEEQFERMASMKSGGGICRQLSLPESADAVAVPLQRLLLCIILM